MRIALFHNTPSGGAKRAIFEWTKRLSTHHLIDVYTLSTADHEFCDIRPYVQQYRIFDFSPRPLFGSPWGRLNQLQRRRDLGELERIGEQIAGEINAGDHDVVFANTCLYTFIPTLLQFVKIPSVYYLHEPFGVDFVRRFQRPYTQPKGWRTVADRYDPLIRLYTSQLEHLQMKSVAQTDLLLANSLFTQKQMQNAYGIDTPVCHLGVDAERFRPLAGPPRMNYVFSVGELTPRKGFDFIVESLGLIPEVIRPQLRLACNLVDNAERAYVEGLADQHGVDLLILTSLNNEELVIQYNLAKVCVYAPVLEPFGLVPLESMACGTPVVGVAEGGVRETVLHDDTGFLTDRDSEKFAAAVQALLSNPTLVDEMGAKGPDYVRTKWNWADSVRGIEAALARAAKN